MQDWKNKYYNNLYREMNALDLEKQEIIDNRILTGEYKLTSKDNKNIKDLEQEKKTLSRQVAYLDNSEYYKKNEGLDIIAHAISQIEEKKYNWREQDICFWYLYNDFITRGECTVAYLVEEGMEELAKLEILSKFPKETIDTTMPQKLESVATYKEKSKKQGDTYYQLVFYQKNSSPKIRYMYSKKTAGIDPFGGIRGDRTTSYITPGKFSFIADLMAKISEYKFEKFQLTGEKDVKIEEIYEIIESFVAEFKNNLEKNQSTSQIRN